MNDIFSEIALLIMLISAIGSCSVHYARKSDALITRMVAEAMEARR
jgi:hypothetical protein